MKTVIALCSNRGGKRTRGDSVSKKNYTLVSLEDTDRTLHIHSSPVKNS